MRRRPLAATFVLAGLLDPHGTIHRDRARRRRPGRRPSERVLLIVLDHVVWVVVTSAAIGLAQFLLT